MLLHILCSIMMMVSAVMCAPGQGRENTRLIRKVETDNHSKSNSIVLDPIGGGGLIGAIDSYMEPLVLRSLHGGEEREIIMRLAREDTSSNQSDTSDPNRGPNLDPIGGDSIVRSLDSSTGGQVHRSLDRSHVLDSLDGGEGRENAMRLVRNVKSNKPSNSNRITLDKIGCCLLLRPVDSHKERRVLRSLDGGEGRIENVVRLARDDKSNNRTESSNPNRGTLDHIGGGNLLGSIDSYMEQQVLRSLDGGEGRENIVRLARDHKSKTRTGTRKPVRGTLDSLGKGHILRRSLDSYTGGQVHRSLEGENTMRLAREDNFNTSYLSDGIVDELGGDNLLSLILLYSFMGGQGHRSLDRNLVLGSLEIGKGGEYMSQMERGDKPNNPHGTRKMHAIVDPLGGGHLLMARDSYTKEDKSNNDDDTSNSVHAVVDPLGGGNLVSSRDSYIEDDKSNNPDDTSNSVHGVVDSLGGGNMVKSRDSYTEEDKSNNPADTSNSVHGVVDSLGGDNMVKSRNSYTEEDKSNNPDDTSNSVHAVVDSLGGGNMVKSRNSYTEEDKSNNPDDTSNSVHAVVDPLGGGNLVKSRNWYSREDKVDNPRNSTHHTLDHLGGGGILRSLD